MDLIEFCVTYDLPLRFRVEWLTEGHPQPVRMYSCWFSQNRVAIRSPQGARGQFLVGLGMSLEEAKANLVTHLRELKSMCPEMVFTCTDASKSITREIDLPDTLTA